VLRMENTQHLTKGTKAALVRDVEGLEVMSRRDTEIRRDTNFERSPPAWIIQANSPCLIAYKTFDKKLNVPIVKCSNAIMMKLNIN